MQQVIKIFVYFLLALSVYWGTLLTVFSFIEFYKSFKISTDVFQAVFGVFGLIAWVNAWHYHSQIKQKGIPAIWKKFYTRDKSKIIFTVSGVVIFILFIKGSQYGLNYPPFILAILHYFSLPWIFADSITYKIGIGLRGTAPVLEIIDNLSWLLSITFEIVLFYYISRIVFWRPKKKK